MKDQENTIPSERRSCRFIIVAGSVRRHDGTVA